MNAPGLLPDAVPGLPQGPTRHARGDLRRHAVVHPQHAEGQSVMTHAEAETLATYLLSLK